MREAGAAALAEKSEEGPAAKQKGRQPGGKLFPGAIEATNAGSAERAALTKVSPTGHFSNQSQPNYFCHLYVYHSLLKARDDFTSLSLSQSRIKARLLRF